MTHKFYLIGIVFLVTLAFVSATHAQSPQLLNYQGRILSASGPGVVDATYPLDFALYADITAGSPLWSESQTGVEVRGGVFDVLLGAVNPLPSNLFIDHATLYLEINFNHDGPMSPRQPLTSNAYAQHAGYAETMPDGWVTTSKLADGAVVDSKVSETADIAGYKIDLSRSDEFAQMEYNMLQLVMGNTQFMGLDYDDFSTTAKRDSTATTLSQAANANDTTLNVVSTTGFSNGQAFMIYDSNHIEESRISTVAGGTQLTLAQALTNGYGIGAKVQRTSLPIDTIGRKIYLSVGGLQLDNCDNAANWPSSDPNLLYPKVDTSDKIEGVGSLRADAPSFGTGADGSPTVSGSIATDTYRTPVNGTAGSNSISVGSSSGMSAGDELLLIILQGSGVGTYEFGRIATVNSTAITLQRNLANNFNNGTRVAIRVPNYDSLTIQNGGVVTCADWDGSSGGVVAFRVLNTLTVNGGGTIYTVGKGYRGGSPHGDGCCAQAGESYYGTGGWGQSANYGGGGGGWDGTGGGGGYGCGGTQGVHTGPGAGGGTYGTGTLSTIFLGSAGGGGDSGCPAGGGGDGSGIIIIAARNIVMNGDINADGAQGGCCGRGGGGGSGGSIKILSASLSNGGNIHANGGAGGPGNNYCDNENGGPGGCGRVRLEGCSASGGFSTGVSVSVPSGSLNQTLTKTFGTAQNLAPYDYLVFRVKASQAGSFLQLQMGESSSAEQTLPFSINQANTWEVKQWDLSGIPASQRDGITQMAMKTTADNSGYRYFLDQIETFNNASLGSWISTKHSYPKDLTRARLWVLRDAAVRTTLTAGASSGQNSLSVSDAGGLSNGDTIDLYPTSSLFRERKTISGKNGNDLTVSGTLVNSYAAGSYVERVSTLPQLSIVPPGNVESFGAPLIVRSIRDEGSGRSEDEYYYAPSAPGRDVIVKLNLTASTNGAQTEAYRWALSVK